MLILQLQMFVSAQGLRILVEMLEERCMSPFHYLSSDAAHADHFPPAQTTEIKIWSGWPSTAYAACSRWRCVASDA